MRPTLPSLRTSSTLACGLLFLGGGLLALPTPAAAASYYIQQNLVTNFPNKYTTNTLDGRGTVGDGAVVNAWGLAVPPAGAGGAWWFANNGTGTVSIYNGDTASTPLGQGPLKLVPVAPPAGDPNATATPTGLTWNSSADFPCSGPSITGGPLSGPSRFLVSTEDGNLQCWTATTSGALKSFSIAVAGDVGSIYKGIAVTTQATGNRLYATNFGLHRVEVYDANFQPILLHPFSRPGDVPSDYSPFNVQTITYTAGGAPKASVFVTYAATEEGSDDELDGPGLGVIAEFDTDGTYIRTLQTGIRLNAPWGIALAPAGFGRQSNRLLVGNFGDGTIVAFDLATGNQTGYLRGFDGQALQIDGLWGLAFGNGTSAGQADRLYFTAGPSSENDGTFGSIRWVVDSSISSPSVGEDAAADARLAAPAASPAAAKRSRSRAAAVKASRSPR